MMVNRRRRGHYSILSGYQGIQIGYYKTCRGVLWGTICGRVPEHAEFRLQVAIGWPIVRQSKLACPGIRGVNVRKMAFLPYMGKNDALESLRTGDRLQAHAKEGGQGTAINF